MRRASFSALSFLVLFLLLNPRTLHGATAPAGNRIDSGPMLGVGGPGAHATLRDLDGDGDLDLVIADEPWIADGNGRYTRTSPVPGHTVTLALGTLRTQADLDAILEKDGVSTRLEAAENAGGRFRARAVARADSPLDRFPAATAVTDPPHERYLCLDGDGDYGTAGDASSLDVGTGATDDFTAEMFIYVPDLTNGTIDGLMWKDQSWGVWIAYNSTIAAGADRFVFRIWTGASTYVYFYGDTNLSVGWHHVAAVWDNEYTDGWDFAGVYVDGNPVIAAGSNIELTPGMMNSSAPLFVGSSWPHYPAVGGIDEARLSASVRYAGSFSVPGAAFAPDSETRALWHFDEFPGSTSFADVSGNANTLSAAGDAKTCGLACMPITVTPETLPGGAVGNAYSQTLGASGGTAPYTFTYTPTSGTTVPGVAFNGDGTIAGTPSERGRFDFVATATDNNGCTGSRSYTIDVIGAFGPPPDVSATATSTSSVSVEWAPVADAIEYRVYRRTMIGVPVTFLGIAPGTTFTDTGVLANKTYLYEVRAVSSTAMSDFSAPDAATTVIFTDPAPSVIRAIHVAELRTAVDAMRIAAAQPAGTYSDDPIAAGGVIDADHIAELRSGLATARSLIGLAALTFTDATLIPGSTVVKSAHLTEVRAGTQ